MVKALVKICVVLLVLLVAGYSYIGFSVFRRNKEEKLAKQRIEIFLESRRQTAELVTGVGIFQVLKYSPEDAKQEYPVLVRGIVKMGVDLKDIKVDYKPGLMTLTYPPVKALSVEVLNLVDISGRWAGTDFMNEVHAMKRLYLKREAKRRGLAFQAEKNFQKEMMYLLGELAPRMMVVVKSSTDTSKGQKL